MEPTTLRGPQLQGDLLRWAHYCELKSSRKPYSAATASSPRRRRELVGRRCRNLRARWCCRRCTNAWCLRPGRPLMPMQFRRPVRAPPAPFPGGRPPPPALQFMRGPPSEIGPPNPGVLPSP
uniref:Uncharacterized protein n=1 Tax=Arundo donax TaxID=35708 RepID=A0A0A9E9X8_ARUDO